MMHTRFSRGCRWAAVLVSTLSVAGILQGQSPAPQPSASASQAASVIQSGTTAAAGSPAAKPTPKIPDGVVMEHDVVIGQGGGRDLHAEVAYPKDAKGPLPAVVFIHGGGWVGGTHKTTGWISQLAQAGYFAASIEYRLSKEAKWPAQIEDCKLGVRWLRANAAKYHVDPNRIGAWGASAGGHLVACLGTMADQKQYEGNGGYADQSSAVQAVVDFFGPTDFTRPENYSPQAINLTAGLFGTTYDKDPALWKSGSPVFFVKAGDPPVLMVHGDSDTLVPMAQSTVFSDALEKAGVPHELLVVKNAGHSFSPVGGKKIEPTNAEIILAVKAFFDKTLKDPGNKK